MFCQNCGNEIKEKQPFCRKCGEQVSNTKTSLRVMDLVKHASAFSSGVILTLSFVLSVFYLMYRLNIQEGWAILLLFMMTLLFSGIIAVLLKQLKKIKGKLDKESADKEIESFPGQRKQIEEKSFIPASWSAADATTENLILTKNRISGEL